MDKLSPAVGEELMREAVAMAEKHRAFLHEMPEKAFGEYRTTEYIRGICEGYPLSVVELGMDTGLVCFLDAGRDETVALRADIDAVPAYNGPGHYCGHDAHSASLLGAMHCLCAAREKLPRNVLFIFQPAEEGTRGAKALLDHGLLEKVPQRPECIFGIHNRPEVSCGNVVVHKGPLMSEKSVFKICLEGRAGHGSLPHKCIDPVTAAASLICGIQTVISRNVDPFEPAICTVNSVSAGDSESSAPQNAYITGYIRSFDQLTHEHMCRRLTGLAQGTAAAYQCGCSIDIIHMVPAVDNSEEMYERAYRIAEAAVGEEHICDSDPCMASEDFAVLGSELPAFFFWVGSGTPGRECAPWHDPEFRVDPRYTETAVPLLCAAVLCC